MGEEPQDSKVTTESSQAVLKAVAGRLAKIDAGEMSAIQYVGHDGTANQAVNHTGQLAAVPPPAAPRSQPSPAPRSQPPAAPRTMSQPAPGPAPAPSHTFVAEPELEIDTRVDQRPSLPAPPVQQTAQSAQPGQPTSEPDRGSWWSRLLHKLGIR